jgi:hypothetical protein
MVVDLAESFEQGADGKQIGRRMRERLFIVTC